MNEIDKDYGCGDCKDETEESELSLYITLNDKLEYENIQNILETYFDYTATRVSTAIKILHKYGQCLIYEDIHSNVIAKAQILAIKSIPHSIKSKKLYK